MKTSFKIICLGAAAIAFSQSANGQGVGSSAINLSATINPECRLTAANAATGVTGLTASVDLTGSSLTFANATTAFAGPAEATMNYTATSNTKCSYEVETANDGMKNGLSFRDYEIILTSAGKQQNLTTNSGQSPSFMRKVRIDSSDIMQQNAVSVKIRFNSLPSFTPVTGTYTDTVTVRVFTS